jgi:hypothetical protein
MMTSEPTMKSDSMAVEIHLPPLSDEAAVAVHDVLNEFIRLIESHYFAQIHRYYQDQFADNLGQSPPLRQPSVDDPPF